VILEGVGVPEFGPDEMAAVFSETLQPVCLQNGATFKKTVMIEAP
jgi:hypothetical protein